MSAGTAQRLSLLGFDFNGLYVRHLGRHSQFGINVAHLLALCGIWFGVYAFLDQIARHLGMTASWPVPVALGLAYLATVAINAPPLVTAATAAFVTLLVVSVVALPTLPIWAIPVLLVLLPISYKVQAYSHKIWNKAADMSEFNKIYPPGRDLNLVLLFFEVPICLKYLLFCPKDWSK